MRSRHNSCMECQLATAGPQNSNLRWGKNDGGDVPQFWTLCEKSRDLVGVSENTRCYRVRLDSFLFVLSYGEWGAHW